MADLQGADVDIRPSKRARLDDSAVPTPTPPISNTPQATPASIPITPIPAGTAAIDNDLQREIRAGIVEYVCPGNLGFTGILKQRYTDFMVNEIGVDGKVLHLTSAELRGKDGRRENMNEKQNGKEKEEEKTQENKQGGESDHKMKDVAGAEQKEDAKASEISENDALNAPKLTEEPEVKEEKEEELAEEDLATLHEIFGEETTTQILSLVRSIRKKEHRKAKDFKAVIAPPIKDKEVRTRAHQSLRRIFPNLLESGMERDQSIRIKAVPLAERKGGQKNGGRERNRDRARNRDRDPDPERHRGQLAWEELGGEYLHFSLYKENKDTMEVIGFLGSKLGGGSKAFSFAGTKDRRACTVQRVCVKRQTAERMSNFNRVLFNAAVGNFEYRSNDLGLGDLKGNEFTITLRDCHFQGEEGMNLVQRQQLGNEVVGKAIKDFSEKGFINYYGLQRFGSFSASTDTIGLKMLQEDLRGAVDDLLTYSEVALAAAEGTNTDSNILISQDDRNRAKALHLWKTTGKGSAALDILPRKFTAERNIIQHLSSRNSKSGKYDRKSDWQGALMTIPRSLRLMYVHAYQSLVWNVVAGKRWTTYGTRVVEGDLILVSEHRDKEDKPAVKETVAQDQDGEFVINPSGTEDANADALDFERARALTAAEAASGKYTIWDIVLPQPGFDVEYPKNDIGKFYEEFMGSEKGGELDPHRMRRGWREISLSGGYRKFLARPLTALEYEVRQYVRDVDQFVETDLQKLRREQGVEVDNGAKAPILLDAGAEVDGREEDKKLAVVIKMQLASSQYATVALRELTKADGVKAFKPEFMGGR